MRVPAISYAAAVWPLDNGSTDHELSENDDPHRPHVEIGRYDDPAHDLVVPPEAVVHIVAELKRVPVAVLVQDGH